jgi:large subunit ribosomal protein L35
MTPGFRHGPPERTPWPPEPRARCLPPGFLPYARLHSTGPAHKGCRGGSISQPEQARSRLRAGIIHAPGDEQMPKMKTKSGAAKRFKVTGTGKVVYAQSGKRHGMIKRTKKQIAQKRGTAILFKTDGDNIKKYFLPNG